MSACVHGEMALRVFHFRVSRCFVLRSSFSSVSIHVTCFLYRRVMFAVAKKSSESS